VCVFKFFAVLGIKPKASQNARQVLYPELCTLPMKFIFLVGPQLATQWAIQV
jgi:hypothetical protein